MRAFLSFASLGYDRTVCFGKERGLVIVKSRKSWENIKIMNLTESSCGEACKVLSVIVSLDEKLCSLLKDGNGGGFSFTDFI